MTEGYEGVNKMKKLKPEIECRLTFLLITILGIIGIILLNARVEQLGLVIR